VSAHHPGPRKTQVVLTVDTEPSVAGALVPGGSHTPLIREPIAGWVNGESQGLGFILRTLRRHGLTATFFVETAHTHYFSDNAMGEYVEMLLDAGQDVQLHLHPCWLTFERRREDWPATVTDDCHHLPADRLLELIEHGADKITAWSGSRPTGMRTGNFSTSLSVFEAMSAAGLRYASNICLAVHRPPEPELALEGGAGEFCGVRELPVTCFRDVGPVGRGRLRPMAVTALRVEEQIDLLNAAHANGNAVVVILTHPFEFFKTRNFRYTDLRRNRITQKRLADLCSFLSRNSDRFDVVPLSVAGDGIDEPQTWRQLHGNAFRSVARAVENVVNDRVMFI
jgi:peptidoglycan/xylan/chitin deacetylase (PgdA/CDA1 family)